MPRTRWLVIGFLLAVGIVGGVLNERGPFVGTPPLSYAQFLADVEAGRVGPIVRWRDQIEVTEGSQTMLVIVPPDADLTADLAEAFRTAGVGYSWAKMPDPWLVFSTPWVPLIILVAASFIWLGALLRDRQARTADRSARCPQPGG